MPRRLCPSSTVTCAASPGVQVFLPALSPHLPGNRGGASAPAARRTSVSGAALAAHGSSGQLRGRGSSNGLAGGGAGGGNGTPAVPLSWPLLHGLFSSVLHDWRGRTPRHPSYHGARPGSRTLQRPSCTP